MKTLLAERQHGATQPPAPRPLNAICGWPPSRPEQVTNPRPGGALIPQTDVPALVIGLAGPDRGGGQLVQGPAGGDQARVRVYCGLRLAEGRVEVGRVIEELRLAADQRGGPCGRRPRQEVRG